MDYNLKNMNIAVIGLGYVGMPLAVALAKYNKVIGYDINKKRVDGLKEGYDSNHEIRGDVLENTSCMFTSDINTIKGFDIFIVTVPTPIDSNNDPDLSVVEKATQALGSVIAKDSIIVYESTVYPGVTENICGPILEKVSGLKCGEDFFLGYSPERINPGDQVHTVENITKVVAGQNDDVAELLVQMYGQMNNHNIFKAKDIKTAEASKAIENAQRDINIAFINEVTMLLNKHGLSAYDVLEAARTKWNFLPFSPGLVGGHCIGVDPYYLAKSAVDVGHTPEVILAGRKTNDSMGCYLAGRMDEWLKQGENQSGSSKNILIMGFTFKENINDIRNTKVTDVIHNLKQKGYNVDIHDPHASAEEVENEYGLKLLPDMPEGKKYDCLMLAVCHNDYMHMDASDLVALLNTQQDTKPFIYDIKGIWKQIDFSQYGIRYETL